MVPGCHGKASLHRVFTYWIPRLTLLCAPRVQQDRVEPPAPPTSPSATPTPALSLLAVAPTAEGGSRSEASRCLLSVVHWAGGEGPDPPGGKHPWAPYHGPGRGSQRSPVLLPSLGPHPGYVSRVPRLNVLPSGVSISAQTMWLRVAWVWGRQAYRKRAPTGRFRKCPSLHSPMCGHLQMAKAARPLITSSPQLGQARLSCQLW